MTDTRVTELLETLAVTAPQPSEDPVEPVHRAVRRRPRPLFTWPRLAPALVAAATAVAVLLAAGVVALGSRSHDTPTPPATPSATLAPTAAQDALAAGRQFVRLFLNADYRTFDEYDRRVLDASTGAFRADFASSRQEDLQQRLTNVHNVTRANVLTAAVRDVTATTATVLVVADQSGQNDLPVGRVDLQRVGVTEHLRLVNGRWLVEDYGLTEFTDGGCADAVATPESDELLRQSCAAVERLFSFDYRTPDADFTAQRALVTDVALVSDHPGLRPAAAGKEHDRVTAAVTDAAIERQTPSSATVLAYLEQYVNNDVLTTAPGVERTRVELSMTKRGDRWLISGVRAL